MFRGLCGAAALRNVVVLTTFWDQVSTSEGERREAQLKSNFFKDFLIGEACFMRHGKKAESARSVLKHISTLTPTITQIQRDIRERGNSLEDTAAGSVLRDEVEFIIGKYKEEVADLKVQIGMITNSSEVTKRELREEQTKLQQELARWDRERAELKKGLGEAKKSREQLEAKTSELQAQLVGLQETKRMARKDAKINLMDSPPPYEDARSGKPQNLSVFPSS
jgi:Arc/MetJ-type ribon-helix-helix transcriptional regulator